jgi:hypothetical protein
MATAFQTALDDAIDRVLRSSNLPGRRPSSDQPPFWARPITETLIRPLAAGGWSNFIEVRGQQGYLKRINGYVATTFGDQTLSGVQFRFILNGGLAVNMALADNVDHNKISPSTFPVVFQKTFFLLGQSDRLIIQARNTGVFQQLVCAALVGWIFENTVSPDKNAAAMTTDEA